jgi:DNA-binding HxlR family transcriptional regulator
MDLVKEILAHTWHGPILHTLADGPLRYSRIGNALVEQVGDRPGDGTISEDLRKLKARGLVTRQRDTNAGYHEWALTRAGVDAVNTLDRLALATPPPPAVIPDPGTTRRPHRGPVATSDSAAAPVNSDTLASDNSRGVTPAHRPHPAARPGEVPVTNAPDEPDQDQLSKIDTSAPHSARVWNYWLGGKDNFAVDRQMGDQVKQLFPDIVDIARASRQFLARAVRYLAGDAGVYQFLDVGTGLPTADNTHQVAQRIAPQSRIVYVDNDPLVLAHARALLTSSPGGATAYVEADVRDPDSILDAAAKTLDFTQPVALMMLGILGNVVDYDEARSITRRLVAAVPSGSYLVINDGTNVINREARDEATRLSVEGGMPYISRSPKQIAGFFHGLNLIEPGVVSSSRWRPDPADDQPDEVDVFCGVARKP